MRSRSRWVAGFVAVAVLGVGWAIAQNRAGNVAPETLIPGSSAVYFTSDGMDAHQAAWEQTAAHDALIESGLVEALRKMLAALGAQARQDPQAAQAYELATAAVDRLWSSGFTFGASGSLQSPPFGVLVIHEGAGLRNGLTQLVTALSRGEVQLSSSMMEGRSVVSTQIPETPAEVAWWSEGGHLVIAFGIQPAQQAISVASGNAPNILEHRLLQKYGDESWDAEQTAVGWIDFQAMRDSFGGVPLPIPVEDGQPPVQFSNLLSTLGLDTLEEVVCQSGFEGRSCRTRTSWVAPGPKRGLLALADQSSITLADLPPLPAQLSSFRGASFDAEAAATNLVEVMRNVMKYGPQQDQQEFEEGIARAHEVIGLRVIDDLLKPLGDVHCFYNDAGQGLFGMGIAIVSKVDDADRLRQSIDHLLGRAVVESRGKVSIQRSKKGEREISLLQVAEMPFAPAICIDEEWMCIGMSPQIVESFLLRLDGDLERWQPDEQTTQLLSNMPEEFVSISISDPRPGYHMLMTWGPMVAGMAQTQMQQQGMLPEGFQLPFSVADIPPVELVTGPLHVNIRMEIVTEQGGMSVAKTSLSGIPLIGGGGGPSVATSGVLVALLLPAVQQAREAARRTQSMNNVKQILLAMHNYHDTHKRFPQGTVPNPDLEPQERLSWLVSILPFLEQQALYEQMDMSAGWKEQDEQLLDTVIPTLINPSDPLTQGQAVTTYAGCAGVGEDAPLLPARDKRAGIFGYDRESRIRDILDGTSNTIAVFEVNQNQGSWMKGGPSTIRALTAEPYINGPDGIGGHHAGGVIAGVADGSVRFISEDIDPEVMRALATQAGGEVIGDF